MVVRVSALALACAFVLGSAPSHAGVIDKAQKAEAAGQQSWSAWGGDIGFRWNRGILGNIGIHIEASPTGQQLSKNLRGHEWFDVRETGGLTFTVKNGSMQQFTGGMLQMRGGYVLRLADGSAIDLRDLSFRIRADDPKVLDVVSGDGTFRSDDRDLVGVACEHLPPEPFDADTWPKWTRAVSAATGKKGRALFHPLRLALTGREQGPELKALLPLIGRARALRRLEAAAG